MSSTPSGNRPDIAIIDPPFALDRHRVPSLEADRELSKLARLQSGVLARQQLIDLGLSSSAIARWVSKGRLHRVVDGVYALGHDRLSQEGRWAAALLFAGPTACLSHRTACRLWGIDGGTGRIEVIRDFNRSNPRRTKAKDYWLTVHRTRHLPEQDLTRHRGFPVTTVARAMLDLAPRLSDTQLRKFLAEAARKRVANRADLHRIVERGEGRRGIGKLRLAVEEWDPQVANTKSDLEARFLELRRKYRIPEPEVNVNIGDFEVDCYWRDRNTIVELDTYTFHGDPVSFENDHSRDLILEGMGFTVHRITGAMLDDREAWVMNTLRNLLIA